MRLRTGVEGAGDRRPVERIWELRQGDQSHAAIRSMSDGRISMAMQGTPYQPSVVPVTSLSSLNVPRRLDGRP